MASCNVGIIGAGRIGQVHLQGLRSSDIAIKTVSDTYMTETIAADLFQKGIAGVDDAEEIFKDTSIHAVFICSPTSTHCTYSLRAIEEGKHVFCEKPIAMNLEEIRSVLCALEGTSIKYQVGFNRRFDHNFAAVRQAVVNGRVGTPQMIRVTSRDPAPPPIEYIQTSGGIFLDMMIHDFDMARFQTGAEVTEVFATGAVLVDPAIGDAGDVDSAIVTLRFSNGMIGYIENCRKAVYGYDQRVEILGTEGAVCVDNDTYSTATISTKDGVCSETPLWFFLERYKEAYVIEQQAFFQSIKNNTTTQCTAQDGYEAVRIAFAAKKSLAKNIPIKMEDI